jgi:hypothetical protein
MRSKRFIFPFSFLLALQRRLTLTSEAGRNYYRGSPAVLRTQPLTFVKIGYAKSAPAPAPQSCIPTYTACVYHSCGGHGCYWADCSNNIPGASMCQSDPYGSWCTTTYCG